MSDYEKEENLRLWQSQTSKLIPLQDIDRAVYRSNSRQMAEGVDGDNRDDNKLCVYIKNTEDGEIRDFLLMAKDIEEQWGSVRDPWYYPRKRNASEEAGDFNHLIKVCKAYDGTRMKERYAMQIARALYASRRYADCIEHCDTAFAGVDDSSLMKRMAMRYAAGCWSRLGDDSHADSLFATAGDIWSLRTPNPVEYMAKINPSAPQIMDYIRNNACDTAFMLGMKPLAQSMLASRRVKHKGDWSFMMAYTDNEYNGNLPLARKEMARALGQSFSSPELRDLARAYKMKLDGKAGDAASLLSDLRWLESKTSRLSRDADRWIGVCNNIVYSEWIPCLWKKGDYATALLLCSYADNLGPLSQRHMAYTSNRWIDWCKPMTCLTMEEIRQSEKFWNEYDYSSLSFQMMGSLSSEQLASAYASIMSDNPLYSFLRRKAHTDRDYFYEVIGTLALREENYSRAVGYLSNVTKRYLRTMNIDKEGYLARDPFSIFGSRWKEYKSPYSGETWEYEGASVKHSHKSNPGAKLSFALKMLGYKQAMANGKTADERGMARLMYAIGRRNSFEECWALTQYWRGSYVGLFEPVQGYSEKSPDGYAFLYDYESSVGHKATEKIYKDEVAAALAMLATDEAKAEANYILGNLRAIVAKYGDTPTARLVKTSCDNWKSWL